MSQPRLLPPDQPPHPGYLGTCFTTIGSVNLVSDTLQINTSRLLSLAGLKGQEALERRACDNSYEALMLSSTVQFSTYASRHLIMIASISEGIDILLCTNHMCECEELHGVAVIAQDLKRLLYCWTYQCQAVEIRPDILVVLTRRFLLSIEHSKYGGPGSLYRLGAPRPATTGPSPAPRVRYWQTIQLVPKTENTLITPGWKSIHTTITGTHAVGLSPCLVSRHTNTMLVIIEKVDHPREEAKRKPRHSLACTSSLATAPTPFPTK